MGQLQKNDTKVNIPPPPLFLFEEEENEEKNV